MDERKQEEKHLLTLQTTTITTDYSSTQQLSLHHIQGLSVTFMYTLYMI